MAVAHGQSPSFDEYPLRISASCLTKRLPHSTFLVLQNTNNKGGSNFSPFTYVTLTADVEFNTVSSIKRTVNTTIDCILLKSSNKTKHKLYHSRI